MKRPAFSFGGCVYRMLVDGRHAAALAVLAAQATVRDDGPALAGIDYEHTSNLYAGRMLWLRRQIDDKRIKWAVSVDGDTTFEGGSLLHEMQHVDASIAVGLAPVRIGGTESLCNLCITDADEQISATIARDGEKIYLAPSVGRRAYGDEIKAVLAGDRRITSGGFGVVVFNLDWYRQCWPDPSPERCSIDTGEDIEHCRSVRARGGGIIALNVRTDHYAWGERQTR